MDGIPAVILWIWRLKYFIPYRTQMDPREGHDETRRQLSSHTRMHNSIPMKHLIPTNMDHITSITTHSGSSALLYVFADNQAVVKMIIKGRSSTMGHVSRNHRAPPD